MNDLAKLDELLRAFSLGLSPASRRDMAREAAKALRKSNAERIGRNVTPAGDNMPPRKFPLRSKSGRIRKKAKMFGKLRQARRLVARSDADGLEVGFLKSKDSRIARVHHEGLEDFTSRRTRRRTRYPERPLLGFSPEDEDAVLDAVMKKLDI